MLVAAGGEAGEGVGVDVGLGMGVGVGVAVGSGVGVLVGCLVKSGVIVGRAMEVVVAVGEGVGAWSVAVRAKVRVAVVDVLVKGVSGEVFGSDGVVAGQANATNITAAVSPTTASPRGNQFSRYTFFLCPPFD